MSLNREFERWKEMIASVDDKSSPSWQWHGRHGVTLDPRWRKFECFIEDVGLMPGYNSALDREPGTDMFTIKSTQWRKGKERILTVLGNSKTISEWSTFLGIPKATIDTRIRKNLPLNLVLSPGKLSIRDLTGRRYGMLVVIDRGKNMSNLTMWQCKCDCGSRLTLATKLLLTGKIKSCGCVPSKDVKNCPDVLIHNGRKRRLQEWSRLTGVPVKSIKLRIRSGYTVDQALGYEPLPEKISGTKELSLKSGVKESTIRHRQRIGVHPDQLTQIANIEKGKLYEYDGLCMTIDQWAVYLNESASTIRSRIYQGWSFEDAIRLPSKGRRPSE